MEEENTLTAKEIFVLVFSFFYLFLLVYFCVESFTNGFNFIMFLHFLVLACVSLGFIILFFISLFEYLIEIYKNKMNYYKSLEAENKLLCKQNADLILEKNILKEKINDK